MSDIPDGAARNVAQMAIAWEIAKDAMGYIKSTRGGKVETDTGRVEVFTELFNQAYYALLRKKQINYCFWLIIYLKQKVIGLELCIKER